MERQFRPAKRKSKLTHPQMPGSDFPFQIICAIVLRKCPTESFTMPFTLATWNINSVRLREGLVARLMADEQPDILCLQECKSPVENIPLAQFQALGYRYMVARGQKGYNGVAILSKLPLMDAGDRDFAQMGHARHVAARLENGVTIHNCYVPAGGDIPDRDAERKIRPKARFPDRHARLVSLGKTGPRHSGWRSEHRARAKMMCGTTSNC